jgi:hypothetical protein
LDKENILPVRLSLILQFKTVFSSLTGDSGRVYFEDFGDFMVGACNRNGFLEEKLLHPFNGIS